MQSSESLPTQLIRELYDDVMALAAKHEFYPSSKLFEEVACNWYLNRHDDFNTVVTFWAERFPPQMPQVWIDDEHEVLKPWEELKSLLGLDLIDAHDQLCLFHLIDTAALSYEDRERFLGLVEARDEILRSPATH